MQPMYQQIGKIVFVLGLAVAAGGGLVYLLGRAGLTRLPGDISFGGRNWRVFLPIGTSIALSVLLTLLLWLLGRMGR